MAVPVIPTESQPSTAGMTTKVVKGSLWTFAGQVAPMALSLAATPIVIRLLGAENYGLFILVLLVPNYFSFADFGMSLASTKFGSAAFGEGSPEREGRIVRTAAFITLFSSIPLAAAMAILSPAIAGLFNVPDHLRGEAAFAIKLAAVGFVANLLNNIFNTPQLSRLRMDLNISITSGIRLASIIATPIVVYFGGGAVGAVAVTVAASLITLALHMIVSARLLPELAGLTIDRDSVLPMLKFGGSLVIAGIAVVLLANLEKLILTRETSVETLAYYSVALTVAGMLSLVSASIVQSIMPAFSQLQGEGNRSALHILYSRSLRLTLIWLVPAVVFMVFIGRPFFTYWFSEEFGRESTVPYYITMAGFFFNVLAYFPYAAIMAAGRSELIAKLYWIELLPYILLVWWLASTYGAIGAAAAWSIRLSFDGIMVFCLAHRFTKIKYLQSSPGLFAVAILIMLLPMGVYLTVGELNIWVIALTAVSVVFYSLIIWNNVLGREEAAWMAAKLNGFLRTSL